MSEYEHDDVVWSAVDSYRADTETMIRPTGSAAAYATLRRRRRVRSAGVAASALSVVLAAGAAFTTFGGSGPTVPTPGGSADATPTASPTTRPSPVPVATGGTWFGLAGAVLDLPARTVSGKECPPGPTRFQGGRAGSKVWIDSAVETDLDGDGRPEQVALIYCRPGEIPLGQVVAFRRDGAGFATLGVVVQVAAPKAPPHFTPTAIERITRLAGDVSGEIRVEVGNLETTYSDTSAGPIGLYQWRSYRWDGTAFQQSGGSRSFVFDADTGPTHVGLPRADVSSTPDGGLSIEVRIEVGDLATVHEPVTVLMSVAGAPGVTVVGEGCPEGAPSWARCPVAAGQAVATFTLKVPAGWTVSRLRQELGDDWVYIRIGDQEFDRMAGTI
ncbi:hypothetical protein [Catellatospora methionotrophica]|uniref:hypothetical protein n=1 Tax=Catellatospora methionotrophica TaxID=121620 RepID=UPI0033F41C4F